MPFHPIQAVATERGAEPHRSPPRRWSRSFLVLTAVLSLALLPACDSDSATGPESTPPSKVGVVVNSIDLSLTIFQVDDPNESDEVELGAGGTPVGAATRGDRAAVPMGTVPALAVVDLTQGVRIGTVSLPEGSGATGAAFVDDTLVVVGNPDRNSVSVVNLAQESLGPEVETGDFPQRVLARDGRVFVVNAELDAEFQPARNGTITVLDGTDFSVLATIELSGENPGGAAFGPDGLLYVSLSGSFGAENGALSVVDPQTLSEVSHHTGFGDFPGSVAVGPEGLVHLSSYAFGVVVWDPAGPSFIRPPEDAVAPGGIPSAAGLGIDEAGRLYTLTPDCQEPTTVKRLASGSYEVEEEIQVGTCPTSITFTEIGP